MFILNSILLGIGLAMDAFSVSLADGLKENHMKAGRMSFIAGIFGVFQTAMPLIGWFCVHTIASYFKAVQPFIPYIALILLLYIGGNMIKESFHPEVESVNTLNTHTLLLQGVATSIDALSVGFTIASYNVYSALLSTIIIGITTFIICMFGLQIGKKFGTKYSSKATLIGGIILICIGLEIFITSFI